MPCISTLSHTLRLLLQCSIYDKVLYIRQSVRYQRTHGRIVTNASMQYNMECIRAILAGGNAGRYRSQGIDISDAPSYLLHPRMSCATAGHATVPCHNTCCKAALRISHRPACGETVLPVLPRRFSGGGPAHCPGRRARSSLP